MGLYDSIPDVSQYAATLQGVINYSAPDQPIDDYHVADETNHARLAAQGVAPIAQSLPYTGPPVLSYDQLRWQLNMMMIGGFTGLLLYSYMFERPLFG